MVQWVVVSIFHGVDPLSYFSFQPVLQYYPVCGIVHIKEPLLLIGKSSPCGGSGFLLSLCEWSFTICLTPYNRGAGRSSEVERSLMVRWIVRSILHGADLIELFLVPASAPRLVQQRPWYVLPCLWDGAYKRTLAANRKE